MYRLEVIQEFCSYSNLVVKRVEHRIDAVEDLQAFQREAEAARSATDVDGRLEAAAHKWSEVSRWRTVTRTQTGVAGRQERRRLVFVCKGKVM